MIRLVAAAFAAMLLVAGPALAAPATDPARMPAGTYRLEKTHASLLARVRHMGLSSYTMRFNRFDARYDWDPKAPEAEKLTVSIDMTSLDVGDPKTSKSFAEDFLDARKNPKATFVSTAIVRDGDRGKVTGDLTFHGVTKPVTLDVVFRGYESGLLGARAGFSATGAFKRSDFGSDTMSMFAADDIELIIEVEFTRQ
ncbi:MAG: polyisoprenoid-binding protein [Caulobacteraceae bacterium]|nr:MAG: polyisoprenoid-binding protein [Caulobacteraceae bacterium]